MAMLAVVLKFHKAILIFVIQEMQKGGTELLFAYDTILQRKVSANEVSKCRMDEPFRYECLCCGEEVHIAAAGSSKRTPHFRHLHGNSSRDCELYLGNLLQNEISIESAVTAAQKRAHSQAGILFDSTRKVFYFSVSFSAEKIQEYESKHSVLQISSNESVLINRTNFSPDNSINFPLKLTSNSCVISIFENHETVNRICFDILRKIEFPTFFKVQTSGDEYNMAKRHAHGNIFTKSQYYLLAEQRSHMEKLLNYSPVVSLGNIEKIDALGSIIFGAPVTISSISKDLSETLEFFGYTLRETDYLIPLWPPTYWVDGVLCCKSQSIFISSSFELLARGNISCNQEAIERIDNIYKVDISDPIKICQPNGEVISITLDESYQPIDILEQGSKHLHMVDVTENGCYYRIDSGGYCLLPIGKYYLSKDSTIVRYLGNYPETVYLPASGQPISFVRLLHNIQRYYIISIPFTEESLINCKLSKVAEIFIENCRNTGVINRKVLEYIRAGKI